MTKITSPTQLQANDVASPSNTPTGISLNTSIVSQHGGGPVGGNVGVPITDLSRMSRREIEQLYYYNAALLEQQKRLTKLIETHLVKLEQEQQENQQNVAQSPTSLEMNKSLEFVMEPESVANVNMSISGFSDKPTEEFEDWIVGGTPLQPIINSKYDVYKKLLKHSYKQ